MTPVAVLAALLEAATAQAPQCATRIRAGATAARAPMSRQAPDPQPRLQPAPDRRRSLPHRSPPKAAGGEPPWKPVAAAAAVGASRAARLPECQPPEPTAAVGASRAA